MQAVTQKAAPYAQRAFQFYRRGQWRFVTGMATGCVGLYDDMRTFRLFRQKYPHVLEYRSTNEKIQRGFYAFGAGAALGAVPEATLILAVVCVVFRKL